MTADDEFDDASGEEASALPERKRMTRGDARRLGDGQQFWCVTKCFVREVLEGREIAIVDDSVENSDGELVHGEDEGLASEMYELRRRGGGVSDQAASEETPRVVRRVEICGFVVERRVRKDSKIIFTVDDGSGCVECVVWTQDGGVSGEQLEMFGIGSTPDGAVTVAKEIRVGTLACVQGRIRDWQGRRQINVDALQPDLDPNEELLFWLDASRS